MVLKGLTWLVLLQIVGSLVSELLLPVLPGSVIGLLLLFGYLLLRGGVSEPLGQATSVLLQYLPLLFVVPAAGIMLASDALLADLPAILTALCLSLLVTVPLCGWMMQRLAIRVEQREEGRHE
ncbi:MULTISPECIES: CidA/LrgA family protein [Pseudomonas]|uniref:CidA/LrgA family protein n=1 Tax=Pseudomonas spirodelae TaxID=3101751 RepID=A0ABU5P7Q6_9PSED|nr:MULTISPECIES: CidA/LrgA family protein [unclassified Pseudomonas]MBU0901107.1 CidA/LrgA family protein [Gammaproteobacteria bacterium]MDD2161669.1 CidA/LrgA family protein [Pseudomonas sp. MIL19]MEA1605686.1 CidA/LrgA family protein [Pseudomonas sp. T5W1]